MKYTIYIPSKGRHDCCLAPKLFHDSKLVVEPQDYDNYASVYPKDRLIMLDDNNRGITYVRNFIKKYSIAQGEKWHWQIDDDIRYIKKRIDNKNVKSDPDETLSEIEIETDQYMNVGIASMSHDLFAFAKKDSIAFNRQAYTIVLVNNELDIEWSEGMIEDVDYSLQVLNNKWCTLVFNHHLFSVPTTKSMKGGNTDISHSLDNSKIRCENFCIKWPMFDYHLKNDLYRLKPNRVWSKFPQRPSKENTHEPSIFDINR